MILQTFRGIDRASVFAAARAALGEDVMIVRTRVYPQGGRQVMEVLATTIDQVDGFRRRLEPDPIPLVGRRARRGGGRPFVAALVGPTGAGKTTTVAKMAVHPRAFGERRVGLLTLDTYRVGALEQLTTLAEIAGLPLEVVYQPQEAAAAMERLAGCDVVLVDTPGRSPRAEQANQEWGGALASIQPDEVHLVLPATLRADIARSVRDGFGDHGVTHLLLSKLDEVPGESGVADLAMEMDLPARWITDGQEIPTDLRAATPRILASIGIASPESRSAA